jgi:hypothetical protein
MIQAATGATTLICDPFLFCFYMYPFSSFLEDLDVAVGGAVVCMNVWFVIVYLDSSGC